QDLPSHLVGEDDVPRLPAAHLRSPHLRLCHVALPRPLRLFRHSYRLSSAVSRLGVPRRLQHQSTGSGTASAPAPGPPGPADPLNIRAVLRPDGHARLLPPPHPQGDCPPLPRPP